MLCLQRELIHVVDFLDLRHLLFPFRSVSIGISSSIWVQHWRNWALLPHNWYCLPYRNKYFLHIPVLLSTSRDTEKRSARTRAPTSSCAFRCYHSVSRILHVWMDSAERHSLDCQSHWSCDPGDIQLLNLPKRVRLSPNVIPQIRRFSICSK